MDIESVINGGTELREGRREMTSGQIKRTPFGDVRFTLKIDMPGRVSEDDFKRYMCEYGQIIESAFKE